MIGKLMTVLEIHDNALKNLCCPDGTFYVPYGFVTSKRMAEAYPDRGWLGEPIWARGPGV